MLWLLDQIEYIQPDTIVELLPYVSLERRKRLQKTRDKSSIIQSVLAELLLRYAVNREHGLKKLPPILISDTGKPFFYNFSKLHFNLSHCGTAVACALGSFPLGVDVQEFGALCNYTCNLPTSESSRKKYFQIEQQYVSASELRSLLWVLSEAERTWVLSGESNTECERRFITLWTFKEAYGKALGKGILYQLDQNDFLPCLNKHPKNGFIFQSFSQEKTVLTLCSHTEMELKRISFCELRSSFLPK